MAKLLLQQRKQEGDGDEDSSREETTTSLPPAPGVSRSNHVMFPAEPDPATCTNFSTGPRPEDADFLMHSPKGLRFCHMKNRSRYHIL